MNRRGFLTALAAVATGAVLDPERALWIPGKKLISIPAPPLITTGWATPANFNLGDIVTFGCDPRRYVVCAAGKSFADIRFRHYDRGNALIYPLRRASPWRLTRFRGEHAPAR